jgi:hypothetical protein
MLPLISAIILAVVLVVLGDRVYNLFQKNKELESRLDVIEGLKKPFSGKIVKAAPAPLKCVTELLIHIDELFWRKILGCTDEELKEVQQSFRLHSDFSRMGVDEFENEKEFYADVVISIQEWRGGYTHVHVSGPGENSGSYDCYAESPDGLSIWMCRFPDSSGGFNWPLVRLAVDGSRVRAAARIKVHK